MSASFCLHTELASVMESLVLAAVAGLKRLAESADTDSQHVMVQFASVMETLGNEALGKILSILDKARIHLKLDKLKNPSTTKPHVLYILHSSRVGVEHSYGAIRKRSRTQPIQDDHCYGANDKKSDKDLSMQRDAKSEKEECVEPEFVPAITVKDKWGKISLEAIADNVEHSYKESFRIPDETQPTKDDHPYGATHRMSDKPQEKDEPENAMAKAESEFVPAITVNCENINLDYIADKVEHSHRVNRRKPKNKRLTQDSQSYRGTDRKSDHLLAQVKDLSDREDKRMESSLVPVISTNQDKCENMNLDSSLDRAAAEMSNPVTFSPVLCTSEIQPTPYVLQSVTWKFFSCTICGKAFCNENGLKVHMCSHSGEKPFKCPICQSTFSMRRSLNVHMCIHTGERPFKCTECGKGFVLKDKLKGHMHVHTGQKPYTCKMCGRSFTATQNLSRHMRSHTGKKPYTCTECGRSFTRSLTLRDHMTLHTGIRPFKCSVCGRTFNHKTNLQTHERIHTGERPFACSICSKAFRTNAALQIHQRVHTGEKPYSCTVCGRAFSQQSSLIVHSRAHSNERDYACPSCTKTFNNPQNLKLHLRVHSGERPHICSVCGKTFTQSTHLRTHKLHVHGGVKQCMCEHCGKTYADRRTLRVHKCVYK